MKLYIYQYHFLWFQFLPNFLLDNNIKYFCNCTSISMWKNTPTTMHASLMIIKWVILGLFSLDIDNPCVWAVAGESGLPSMRKLLLTIKGRLFGNSFPWLSFWWTSCYLTVELIFSHVKLKANILLHLLGSVLLLVGPVFFSLFMIWEVDM